MRQIIGSKPYANQSFQVIGGKIIKATLVIVSAEVFCKDEISGEIAEKALIGGSISAPNIRLSLTEATESDLLTAKQASPEQSDNIDALIKVLRESDKPTAPPLRVEITNASEFSKDTVLRVQRDEDGKLTGATAVKV